MEIRGRGGQDVEYKYIQLIPKPLLNDFVNNRVIPFVGAGFSKNADVPESLTMPDWNELGKLAAAEITDYVYDNNAIDALSYYEDLYSRTKLVEFLMKELHFGKIQPGATYRAFCDLFTGIICTTNFDSLLEDTLTLLHRPVSVVTTKDRLTIGDRDESRIVKLHGDFNHPDRMVITEKDYDLYIERNPIFSTYIANLFITNTMLLIGYSLDDDDFRGIWQIIISRLGNMTQPAYCILVNAHQEKIARYRRRNIRVINLEGEAKDYKNILCDFFVELKDYIDQERDKAAESIDEKINEQMIIPAEDNRLCFISCAMIRISQLSAMLNPILHAFGITPVRIDDMLTHGENWIDVSSTAIRKSKVAIVDVSEANPNVMFELGLIKSLKKANSVLMICEKGKFSPISDLNGQLVLQYTFDDQDEKVEHHFKKALSEWICQVFGKESEMYNNSKNGAFADAYRLLDKGEYSACIVSAYSELEYQLSLHYIEPSPKKNGFSHFRLTEYLKSGVYNEIPFAKELVSLRNKVVHQRYVATEKEALEFMDIAEKIYENAQKK